MLLTVAVSGCQSTQSSIPTVGQPQPQPLSNVPYDDSVSAIRASLAAYAVSDADIDSHIDANVVGDQRATLRRVMLSADPIYRGEVILQMPDGSFLVNHNALRADIIDNTSARVLSPLNDGLGGEGTGEFRRVTITSPGVTMMQTYLMGACVVGKINEPTDDGYSLIGPVAVAAHFGVDVGYQRSQATSSSGVFEPYFTTSSDPVNKINLKFPCGGTYVSTVELYAYYDGVHSKPTMTVVMASFTYALPGKVPMPAIAFMKLVPISTLAYDGSNSKMRRLTGIAQRTYNPKSGEYYGFAASGSKPNLKAPGLSYLNTTYVAYPSGGEVTRSVATSELSPNDSSIIVVSPDPNSNGKDYNDYEGIYDHP